MENRRRPGRGEPPPPPSPLPSPALLRDVSNFKTPRPPAPSLRNPPSPCPLFFSASKETPPSARPSPAASAFHRRSSLAPSSHSKAARRLKALELEQSRSARRAHVRREKALRSFSRSLSAWLNSLFRDPGSFGCNVDAALWNREARGVSGCGKRSSLEGGGIWGVEGAWRWPKRQRGGSRQNAEAMVASSTSTSSLLSLQVSLKDVCSFEDLKERMSAHLNEGSCQEVLSIMSQVSKNIDEGRLKMKSHCPLVTDVGLREKATKVLMCYNPSWLRVGLHIVFGGDSLLQSEERTSASEDQFVKMVIERQFFSHAGLAKSYAYNKLVEGVYRPGYFEALGSIILKRFLLLVLLLDKAKGESTLPVKYGIDGVDGGSPLLFCLQSHIKSSQQVIHEFLSEVMHGEGDLLAHLVILGCKVSHQQLPLAEYKFCVTNLFEDFQDGVLLCRTIQLLKSDASVLSKLMIPSNTRKRNIQNCNVALQYLKLAGVPLSDEDGVLIVAEDVASGDRELVLSLLWNIFVHLQVPLLINKSVLIEEIAEVKQSHVDLAKCNRYTHMELLLEWIQAITESYGIIVDTFSSLVDGKALCCLVSYYLRHQASKDIFNGKGIPLLESQQTVATNNIVLVQQIITTLGSFPEVLQVSDVLDEDASYDERSVIILLVLLASQLLLKRKMDHISIHQLISSCHQSPKGKTSAISEPLHCQNTLPMDSVSLALHFNTVDEQGEMVNCKMEDHAAMLIQSHFRGLMARKRFLKVKASSEVLKAAMRAWLAVIKRSTPESCMSSGTCRRFYMFMVDRQVYVNMKKSVRVIQKAVRFWMVKRNGRTRALTLEANPALTVDGTVITSKSRLCIQTERSRCALLHTQIQENEIIFDDLEASNGQEIASVKREEDTRGSFTLNTYISKQKSAAIIIQSCWRCWLTKRMFLSQMKAVLKIQNALRSYHSRKAFLQLRLVAIVIQQAVRGQTARDRLLGASCHRPGSSHLGSCSVIMRQFSQYEELKMVVDSTKALHKCWMQILLLKIRTQSAIVIQSCIRGFFDRRKARRMWRSIVIIQKWWRNVLASKLRDMSVLKIQSHVRGWIARQEVAREKHRITVIQAFWKGYLVRKSEKEQLFDLRCRIQKSAANVDDDMRLINRHLSALSLLLNHKSISNIRHACSTLNTATEHSEKCCKILVDAGAIDILLKEIQKLTRSGPDQEVLKQILSILRNIAGYPSLALKLVSGHRSVEIIFQDFLRNKTEGYFVASELLRKLFALEEGREAATNLQRHVRRLRILIQELERKVDLQKRNARIIAGKGDLEQRLKAAVAVLQSAQGTYR